MKQTISEEDIIDCLDFLINLRPFEGTTTLDGKTEFILFWAIHARVPIDKAISEFYWISARWIPKEAMGKFIDRLSANPVAYSSKDYPEWKYYREHMTSSDIYQSYNEMLVDNIKISRIDNQIKRVIDFTIDKIYERLRYILDEVELKYFLKVYLVVYQSNDRL